MIICGFEDCDKEGEIPIRKEGMFCAYHAADLLLEELSTDDVIRLLRLSSHCGIIHNQKDTMLISHHIGQMEIIDVHTEHCCINCGCKYNDVNCTVTTGKLKQSIPCNNDCCH